MGRPENLRYASTHEWVQIDGNIVTVGITDFAVEQLSDLVFLELPELDSTLKREDPFGEIESTKTVSNLYAPVSGNIIEVNEVIVEDLDILKNSPYEDGWMIKIEMSNPDDLDSLITADQYEEQLKLEEH